MANTSFSNSIGLAANECGICGKEYVYEQALYTHEAKEHGVKRRAAPFPDPMTGARFQLYNTVSCYLNI